MVELKGSGRHELQKLYFRLTAVCAEVYSFSVCLGFLCICQKSRVGAEDDMNGGEKPVDINKLFQFFKEEIQV